MSLRILILDDDEAIRATLSKFVLALGFEVESYSEPNNCPAFLTENCACKKEAACADIIITDINMPGTTGISFIENQIQNGCRVKNIAVMSGGWTEESRKQVANLGCKIFEKPFSMFDLKKWLNRIKEELQDNKSNLIQFKIAQ